MSVASVQLEGAVQGSDCTAFPLPGCALASSSACMLACSLTCSAYLLACRLLCLLCVLACCLPCLLACFLTFTCLLSSFPASFLSCLPACLRPRPSRPQPPSSSLLPLPARSDGSWHVPVQLHQQTCDTPCVNVVHHHCRAVLLLLLDFCYCTTVPATIIVGS